VRLAVVIEKVVHPQYVLMNFHNSMRIRATSSGIIVSSSNCLVPGSQLALECWPGGEGAPYMPYRKKEKLAIHA
jgi:hypothetical protein